MSGLLVFGRTGLARELQQLAPVLALGRDAADLAQPGVCAVAIHAHRPRAVINAAAYIQTRSHCCKTTYQYKFKIELDISNVSSFEEANFKTLSSILSTSRSFESHSANGCRTPSEVDAG